MISRLVCWWFGHDWNKWEKTMVGSDNEEKTIFELWRTCERCNKNEEKSYDRHTRTVERNGA